MKFYSTIPVIIFSLLFLQCTADSVYPSIDSSDTAINESSSSSLENSNNGESSIDQESSSSSSSFSPSNPESSSSEPPELSCSESESSSSEELFDSSSSEIETVSSENSSSSTQSASSESHTVQSSSQNSHTPSGSVTVWSYNLLFNGDWNTANRKQGTFDMFNDYMPDIVGINENWSFMGIGYPPTDDIVNTLPDYSNVNGIGATGNLYLNDIVYNHTTYELIESGRFLINHHFRSCVWGLFKNKATGQHIYLFNTHYDWEDDGCYNGQCGGDGRVSRGIKIIEEMKNRSHPEYPAVMTGDLNIDPYGPGLLYLLGQFDPHMYGNIDPPINEYPLRDTWMDDHSDYTNSGTYGSIGGGKIDYVLAPVGEWTVIETEVIDYDPTNGTYPSDHLPVSAILNWN